MIIHKKTSLVSSLSLYELVIEINNRIVTILVSHYEDPQNSTNEGYFDKTNLTEEEIKEVETSLNNGDILLFGEKQ